MGMYTELNIAVNLSEETPNDVMAVLDAMLNDGFDRNEFEIPASIKSHPLFETDRWGYMLRGDSCYFDGFSDSKMAWDKILKEWKMNVRCNFKNCNDEIEKFLSFIAPHLSTSGFIGYMRYEEDKMPTLILRNAQTGEITLHKPE